MKYIVLLLIAACACSAQITRSNYHAGKCATSPSSLYFVSANSFQCLTGTVYPFNGETRSYTCNGGIIEYNNCTDTGCNNCTGPLVTVGASVCIAWTTNDYSDSLTCGSSVPSTPINTPLVSQFDGKGCSGNLQFQGAFGSSYCTESGIKYSCNASSIITYNCTAAGCGNCAVIGQDKLINGQFCSGYSLYQCLNATGSPIISNNTTNNFTATTGSTGSTTSRGTNITVSTGRGTTGAPGGGSSSSSDALPMTVSVALIAMAGLCAVLL